ncbi:CEP104 family protein [Megaselia abdita]
MLKKIAYSVSFVSDEDLLFPASELNSHGPSVYGYRSVSDSKADSHELVLKFLKPALVRRIQILAHQYIIPQQIEVWLHYSDHKIPSTPSSQLYDFIGFITLSDNSATNFKSRELQSANVAPRKGTHLKLKLSSAHKNDFNTNNQVSLLAVNVLGQDFNSENYPKIKENADLQLNSVCDDLLFSMYVEESIADTIRELELKKSEAVLNERFEYARKLKLCMSSLRTAGERLGRYALAKRQAIQVEDFIAAKLRKEQMDIYRTAILKHLLVDELLEKNGLQSTNDVSNDIYSSKPMLPPAPSLQEVALGLTSDTLLYTKSSQEDKSSTDGNSSVSTAGGFSVNESLSHHIFMLKHPEIPCSPRLSACRSPVYSSPISSRHSSLRRRNKSAPRNSYEEHDERTIPTLRQECQGAAILDADPSRGRSKLSDRERRQAALSILIFGNELVELIYSRQFQDREEGLIRLRNFLKEQLETDSSSGVNKIARSTTMLLYRSIRDAVYSVFCQSAETIRVFFIDYVPNKISASEVSRSVDKLLPELLARSGDPSPRIHTLAQHTILTIAACSYIQDQHLVAPSLSRPVGSGTHPRLALSRVQMLEQLVLSQGIGSEKQSGLTCRTLTEAGSSGLHHPAEPVRKVAEKILILVYKINPRLVRKQLPPDDDITRRNLLYRQLFSEFDKIDSNKKIETNLSQSSNCESLSPNHCANSVPRWKGSKIVKKSSTKIMNQHNDERFEFDNDGLLIQCPFCDWKGYQSQLDKHFWKSCPFLTKCPQCSQISEIRSLNNHLINECEAKDNFLICKKCNAAVHNQLLELHLLEEFCRDIKPKEERCPLCHDDIQNPQEEGWEKHLSQPNGCPGNAKRRLNK